MSKQSKSNKEIEAEAKLAVNKVLQAHKCMSALKIRPEIRKAFPFGPGASQREKAIWEKTVNLAMEELEKWPLTLPALLLILSLSISPAFADTFTKDGKQWYRVSADGTQSIGVPPKEVPLKRRAGNAVRAGARKTGAGIRWVSPKICKGLQIFSNIFVIFVD